MTTIATHPPDAESEPAAPRRAGPVRLLRKAAVAVAGTAMIVAGVVMLVLPGPGVVAILAGLGLLGTEFPTARRISRRVNGWARAGWHRVRTRTGRGHAA
ncbi:PGPGW domain-containing protein [Actinomadura sp. 9N215]|uniref:PGPGW domain-containing protein n=1 Tax=Actinomadura sp. 9N215 TaxID=3375150 RepID=UPI0037B16F96